jgi:hypothetical protein
VLSKAITDLALNRLHPAFKIVKVR